MEHCYKNSTRGVKEVWSLRHTGFLNQISLYMFSSFPQWSAVSNVLMESARMFHRVGAAEGSIS